MKIIFFLYLSCLALQAGIKIPKGVFTVDQLAEARAKAIAENSPIVFIYTNIKTK